MITGIDRPTSGEVFVGDTAVHTLNEGKMAVWRGKHVGVIFQFFQLLPTLTLVENVMLPMDFCNTYPASERRDRAMQLLDHVGMAEQAGKLRFSHFWRSAATRRHCPCDGQQPAHHRGRSNQQATSIQRRLIRCLIFSIFWFRKARPF